MSTIPNKKDRRKLKALLAMADKIGDYFITMQSETILHLENDYSTGQTLHLITQFKRNVNDALKCTEIANKSRNSKK